MMDRWRDNPNLYEQDPGMDVRNMSHGQRQAYYQRIFHSNTNMPFEQWYAEDPEPWGHARQEGRLE